MGDFDEWNSWKKEIEGRNSTARNFPKEGEVWMVVFGKNIGYEQNGSTERYIRPGLVIKKFNNEMVWIVPLTTKQKDLDFYFNFTDPNKRLASAILAQLRMISTRRFESKLYEIQVDTFLRIKDVLRSFI